MNDSSEEGEKTIQPVGNIGYKKVLITGQGSYIGTAVERWLLKDKDHYQVDTLDMQCFQKWHLTAPIFLQQYASIYLILLYLYEKISN